jgi:hypothetical protein
MAAYPRSGLVIALEPTTPPPSLWAPTHFLSNLLGIQRWKSCESERLRIAGWEIAHGVVTRRLPNPLSTMVPRTGGYAYDVWVWDLSIVQGPFLFFCRAVPNPITYLSLSISSSTLSIMCVCVSLSLSIRQLHSLDHVCPSGSSTLWIMCVYSVSRSHRVSATWRARARWRRTARRSAWSSAWCANSSCCFGDNTRQRRNLIQVKAKLKRSSKQLKATQGKRSVARRPSSLGRPAS